MAVLYRTAIFALLFGTYCMRACCRKLYDWPSVIIMWSISGMSNNAAASEMRRVTDMSSALGAATPDGWLCTMIIEEANTSIARFTISL